MTEAGPLAALIGRALGAEIADARSETLERGPRFERERITFAMNGVERSLLLERFHADQSRDVKLLPFLARKTDRVPVIHARGEPHAANAPHWLLREDTGDGSACDGEPKAIVDAKLEIERAVANDGPALRALGVRDRSPLDIVADIALVASGEAVDDARLGASWLRRWPAVLCHGDLRCANVPVTPRGAVLVGWGRAHLGCGLLDAVRLAFDLADRGEGILGIDLPKRYAEAVDVPLSSDTLRAAELIVRLERRHLRG